MAKISLNCPNCGNPLTNRADFCKQYITCGCGCRVEPATGRGIISNIQAAQIGRNMLVWKHPIHDFNTNSYLYVRDSQEAFFILNGEPVGPFLSGRHVLDSQQYPFLKALSKAFTGDESVYHSEVYFINTATVFALPWGTDSQVQIIDPLSKLPVSVGVSGKCAIRVCDSGLLLRHVVGTESVLTANQIIGPGSLFGHILTSEISDALPRFVAANVPDIRSIGTYRVQFCEIVRSIVNQQLEVFGLEIVQLSIENFQGIQESKALNQVNQLQVDNYLKMYQLRGAIDRLPLENELARGRAEGQANVELIQAESQRLIAMEQTDAKSYDMQQLGYTYQDEANKEIQLAAASNSGTNVGSAASIGVQMATMRKVYESVSEMMSDK